MCWRSGVLQEQHAWLHELEFRVFEKYDWLSMCSLSGCVVVSDHQYAGFPSLLVLASYRSLYEDSHT
jgi:hypothetical protein